MRITWNTRNLFGGLLLLLSVSLQGQSVSQFGTLPVVNLNIGLSNGWEVNTKWETRQILSTSVDGERLERGFDFALSDHAVVLAKKVGLNSKVAAGYLLRFRDGDIINRSIQQFSVVQRLRNFRLAHRLASDQTFVQTEPVEFRLRYRIGTEFALNGQSADAEEFYLKLNNEYLASWQGTDFDFEIRAVPVLGYKFTDRNKLELGLDMRFDSFLNEDLRRRSWGVIAWYYKV